MMNFLIKSKKLYSIKNIHGKESNAVKGVSVAAEFKEFKETYQRRK